ncbi:hypothetical protein I79_012506 [Cricetulus griseus]|uniref:Uncharacterized protein n=1 Tax=Cricetulus griseus TaxID=10029 RepID=G3HP05_CRIGR|nr:hypothetical protein I79_012506 [Cricetulus griseus]
MKAFPFKSQYRSEPCGGSWGRRALAKHISKQCISLILSLCLSSGQLAQISLIYNLACLIGHTPVWLVSFMSGAGINSAILGKLRKEKKTPRPKHPPHQLKHQGAWCRNMKAETIAVRNLSKFIKVHPQPLPRESQMRS